MKFVLNEPMHSVYTYSFMVLEPQVWPFQQSVIFWSPVQTGTSHRISIRGAFGQRSAEAHHYRMKWGGLRRPNGLRSHSWWWKSWQRHCLAIAKGGNVAHATLKQLKCNQTQRDPCHKKKSKRNYFVEGNMSIGSLVISILSHHQIWYHLSHRYWSLVLSLVARPEMEVSPGFVFKKSLVTCKSGHLGAEQPWRHFPPGAVQSGRRRSTARPGSEHLSDSDSNADVGCHSQSQQMQLTRESFAGKNLRHLSNAPTSEFPCCVCSI